MKSDRIRWLCAALGLGGCLWGAQAADAPRYTRSWRFDQPQADWRLQAESPGEASWRDGALRLQAAMQSDAQGLPHCPVAAASAEFGDAASRRGADQWLRITLDVRRWDLGLGYGDTRYPVLEVVHHGQRTLIGVAGFRTMPGQATLEWSREAGWRLGFGTGVAPVAPPLRVLADSGPPSLRLWIDGCSAGMRQTLQLTGLSVAAR